MHAKNRRHVLSPFECMQQNGKHNITQAHKLGKTTSMWNNIP